MGLFSSKKEGGMMDMILLTNKIIKFGINNYEK